MGLIHLFHSLSIMCDSKQIMKILFLCLLSALFRATADRRVSTKFPTCVTDTFCVWLKMDKELFLVRCVKLRKATISFVMCVRTSVHMDEISWNLVLANFSNMSGKFKFCELHSLCCLYSKLWYWTVSQYKLFIIQSKINNTHYHHNTHHNVLLPKLNAFTVQFYPSQRIQKHPPYWTHINLNFVFPNMSTWLSFDMFCLMCLTPHTISVWLNFLLHTWCSLMDLKP